MRRVGVLGILLLLTAGCHTDGRLGDLSNNPLCEPETDEALCIAFDARCTASLEVQDSCGVARTISCARCPPGQLCNAQIQQCQLCAQIDFCAQSGAQCGELEATPGSLLEACKTTSVGCGACEPGSKCEDDNTCGACTRESDALLCGAQALQCGTHALQGQCGQVADADCGACDEGTCQPDGTCTICKPETDEQFCVRARAANCGEVRELDNCLRERVVDCGMCDDPDTLCDDFSCICPIPTCAPDECGPKSNACGQQADCGGCDGIDQCVNGSCECVPQSPAELCNMHAECGTKTVQDRCMQDVDLDCGACPNNESCVDNDCQCVPEPEAQLRATACMGITCGMASIVDACGDARTFECGTCAVTQVCHMEACCDPIAPTDYCASNSYTCGTYTYDDGCGAQAQAQCGVCSNDDVCTANACEAVARTVLQPHFGRSVALHDGNVVVGAAFDTDDPTKQGHAYLFRASQSWNSPTSRAGSATYGWSVALLGDQLAVGAPGANSVELLRDTGAALSVTQTLPTASAPHPDAHVGFDLSASQIHPTEAYLMVAAPTGDILRSGITYTDMGKYLVVRPNATTGLWEYLTSGSLTNTPSARADDAYWYAAIDISGNKRAYGSPARGTVYIQQNPAPSSLWQVKQTLTKPGVDGFGAQVSLSPDGRWLAITARPMNIVAADFLATYQAPSTGTVYIYEDTAGDGSGWVERAALTEADTTTHFGYAVAMGDDDLFVGMPGAASVRRYTRDAQGAWTLHSTKTRGANFGYAIDFDGRFLVATQHTEIRGTVYLFEIY